MKIVLLLSFFIPVCLYAQTQKYSEYEVKAAFLERFTRFISWPDSIQIENTTTPFVIGIMGSNPSDTILINMYSSQKIMGKKVKVNYVNSINQVKDCNMLLVSKSGYKEYNNIYKTLEGIPLLIVSDDTRLSKRGVHITLYVKNNHVYFEIDQKTIQKSGLYVSSLLLELSRPYN